MSIDLRFSCCDAGEKSSYLVRRYIFLDSDADTGCYIDKHIPEGSCTLIFNFKGEVNMSLYCSPDQKLPNYFLVLPYLGFVNVKAALPIDTFGVACKASVFSAFFGITFDDSETQSYRMIEDVIPQELYEQLKGACSHEMRIKIFEDFLSAKKKSEYAPDQIDLAYEYIYSSNGLVHINELISKLNLNSRSFRRNFFQRVGVSAKSLCRIVRANQVLNTLKESSEIDFQSVVYSGKYFDQPHFVNDFRKFIGESPGTFFSRDLQIVKVFSGL